jgi:hypothetical protein
MLLRGVVVGILASCLLAVAWYLFFLRYNRRRALEVLHWIGRVFGGHGRVAKVCWESASRFQVQMELAASVFRQPSLLVELFPRQQPLAWLIRRFRHRAETLTFQADLDSAPSFDLEVQNHRWYGRTRRRLPAKSQGWILQQVGPFVLTTRNEWQREITTMLNALVASRECDCSNVSFRRSSPHFSVTVPLNTIAPESQAQSEIFDVLRELAAGASTARF